MNRFLSLLKEFKRLEINTAVNYELMNEILISHHSTAIEGSSLTEDETRMLLTEGITAKGKPIEDHNMVKDHHGALLYVLKLAKDKVSLTNEIIQSISAAVMRTTGTIINSPGGTYDSSKGDFRKGSVYVGNRFFTNYLKVPREVDSLCTMINRRIGEVKSDKEIYDLAFDAHFYFVSIHPFADGNGRTSRLLMNYVLSYHDKPLAIIFREDKKDYFNALEASREGDAINLKPIRDFLYTQQEKFLSQEIEKYKRPGLELGL